MKNELKIVSEETAKLLKDAGFDWDTTHKFEQGELMEINDFSDEGDLEEEPIVIPAPTQALAQMWFRDVHNIDIFIKVDFLIKKEKEYLIKIYNSIIVKYNNNDIENIASSTEIDFLTTHEEALEFSIQKACEYLIELKNEETYN
jgi:hypothetical protein